MFQLHCYAESSDNTIPREQTSGRFIEINIDLSNTDPIEFIKILRKYSEGWVVVKDAPNGWIKQEHVEQLMKLIDSKDAIIPVVSIISSYMPLNKMSTVGNEAMFLIEGYKKDRYPPGICSVYGFNGNPEEYKKWYDLNNEK